jgi:hypothetical protein
MRDKIPEAYFIDTFLRAFIDGKPRKFDSSEQEEIKAIESRVIELLVDKNFLKQFETGYIITSSGIIHLEKGGFVGEHIRHKSSVFSFWLSLTATIASLTAIFISVFK